MIWVVILMNVLSWAMVVAGIFYRHRTIAHMKRTIEAQADTIASLKASDDALRWELARRAGR